MDDPNPENIVGQKRVETVHRVEHQINWGMLAAGAGALAVAFVLHRLFVAGSDHDDDDSGVI